MLRNTKPKKRNNLQKPKRCCNDFTNSHFRCIHLNPGDISFWKIDRKRCWGWVIDVKVGHDVGERKWQQKMARQANYRRTYSSQFWCYDDISKAKSKANWMNYTTMVKESIESLWTLNYDVAKFCCQKSGNKTGLC